MGEQQSGCAKCETLIREAHEERAHRLMEAREEFARLIAEANEFMEEMLMEIYSQHERGDHAEDTG
jgi:vacuolar-type H+-ATPase subunit H